MRESLQLYLGSIFGHTVVGTAASGEEALDHIDGAALDLVLVDMSLPGMSGAQLIEHVRDRWLDLPCLVLSGHGDRLYVQQALNAGARGYVMKGDFDELEHALQEVSGGEIFVSAALQD